MINLNNIGNRKMTDNLVRLSELVIGIIFVLSSLGKSVDAEGFGELISSYGLGWFSILSPVIILLEIILGMLMLFHIYSKATAFACIVVVVVFSVAFSYAYLIHGIEDCGCFGNFELRLPVWAVYCRNALLLVLAVFVFVNSDNDMEWRCSSLIIMTIVMLCLTFWVGHTWKPSTFYVNKFPPSHPLLNLPVADTPLAPYVKADNDSTYLVWVFSYTCGGCINSIENVKQYQTGVADKFVPLSVNEDKKGRMHRLLDIPFEAVYVGNSLSGFITYLPTMLYIEDGRIRHIIEDSAPSVYQFKHLFLGMSEQEIIHQTNNN